MQEKVNLMPKSTSKELHAFKALLFEKVMLEVSLSMPAMNRILSQLGPMNWEEKERYVNYLLGILKQDLS